MIEQRPPVFVESCPRAFLSERKFKIHAMVAAEVYHSSQILMGTITWNHVSMSMNDGLDVRCSSVVKIFVLIGFAYNPISLNSANRVSIID